MRKNNDLGLKMMACILDQDNVLVQVFCPICKYLHYELTPYYEYMDYATNGPDESVGRYDGWDDIDESICDDCSGTEVADQYYFDCLWSPYEGSLDYFTSIGWQPENYVRILTGRLTDRQRRNTIKRIIKTLTIQRGNSVDMVDEIVPYIFEKLQDIPDNDLKSEAAKFYDSL